MRKVLLLFLSLGLGVSRLLAAEWEPVAVPGSWEEKGPPAARNYDGVAWYRTWMLASDDFFRPHERNLYEESTGIYLRQVADAYEMFVNGRKVGAAGRFPPAFSRAAAELERFKVPVGTLRKGEWNEIAIRVYNQSGPGGFLGEAPVVMNYVTEFVLAGQWEFRLGDDYLPGAARREKPAGSAFDRGRVSTQVLGRAAQPETGPKLSPQDAWARLKAADDLKVELMLAEPLVAQGMHLSFDARGRLWVAQYRQYPFPAGVKMVGRDQFYRSQYDRVPPPPPNHDRGMDRISIHEDTDGDGVYDRHTVFQDGLNMVTAAVRGGGGVWVMNPPYLMFYPDGNFDDIPDGPPEVRLRGFGLEDSHSVANGLVWGPDGWLYGVQGSSVTSRIVRPGVDADDAPGVYFSGGMVWRYHPVTRAFEVFSEGGSNLFGLELDGEGRLFSGVTTGRSRSWHFVQGGYHLKHLGLARFGPPRNPYTFGDLPSVAAAQPASRFSHFGTIVEGTAMPARYQHHLFAVDPLHNEIIDVATQPLGSTFQTADVSRVVTSDDIAFRPIFAVNAPDGSILVSDMYEYYIAHGQHYQSQIDPDSGRIYRLRGQELSLEADINLERKTSAQLVELLGHPNKWHRQMAAQLLGARHDRTVIPALEARVRTDASLAGLGALWALHQMGELADAVAQAGLANNRPAVRMWSVRFLGDKYGANRGAGAPGIGQAEARDLPGTLLESVATLALRETNAEVRAQVAATARRLTTPQALALLSALLSYRDTSGTDQPAPTPPALAPLAVSGPAAADLTDPYLPLMEWWIVQAHVELDREEVLNYFRPAALWNIPMVQQHLLPRLMRRFALEGRREDLLVCARLLRLAPTAEHAGILLKGFEEAFRGREMTSLPEDLLQALAAHGKMPLLLRVRQGEPAAVQEAFATLANKKAPASDRLLYARIFGEVHEVQAIPVLLSLAVGAEPAPLRKAALMSLMTYDDPEIGPAVVELAAKGPADSRPTALTLLASRATWSLELLRALERGIINANALTADVIERLRGHQDPQVKARLEKLIPRAAAGSHEWNSRIAEVEAILKGPKGNAAAGEPLFLQRCAGCHKLFTKGASIGPDLTTYQRDNLGTMLLSIINPNAEIREGFEYTMVQTNDGRALSGFLVESDSQTTTLRGLEGGDIVLRQTEIKSQAPIGRSLMPEGLLDGLSEAELRDFFAYLGSSQPVSR